MITLDEAIEILSRPKTMKGTPQDILEAHDMAVTALRQPEIIRCRDCRFWDPFPSSSSAPEYHQCNEFGGVMTASRADDYCSRAERRKGNE